MSQVPPSSMPPLASAAFQLRALRQAAPRAGQQAATAVTFRQVNFAERTIAGSQAHEAGRRGGSW
jgi:hypothetical protein